MKVIPRDKYIIFGTKGKRAIKLYFYVRGLCVNARIGWIGLFTAKDFIIYDDKGLDENNRKAKIKEIRFVEQKLIDLNLEIIFLSLWIAINCQEWYFDKINKIDQNKCNRWADH